MAAAAETLAFAGSRTNTEDIADGGAKEINDDQKAQVGNDEGHRDQAKAPNTKQETAPGSNGCDNASTRRSSRRI